MVDHTQDHDRLEVPLHYRLDLYWENTTGLTPIIYRIAHGLPLRATRHLESAAVDDEDLLSVYRDLGDQYAVFRRIVRKAKDAH